MSCSGRGQLTYTHDFHEKIRRKTPGLTNEPRQAFLQPPNFAWLGSWKNKKKSFKIEICDDFSNQKKSEKNMELKLHFFKTRR